MKKSYIYISIINFLFIILPFILITLDYKSSNFIFKYYKIFYFFNFILDLILIYKFIKKEINFFFIAVNLLIQLIPFFIFLFIIFNLH